MYVVVSVAASQRVSACQHAMCLSSYQVCSSRAVFSLMQQVGAGDQQGAGEAVAPPASATPQATEASDPSVERAIRAEASDLSTRDDSGKLGSPLDAHLLSFVPSQPSRLVSGVLLILAGVLAGVLGFVMSPWYFIGLVLLTPLGASAVLDWRPIMCFYSVSRDLLFVASPSCFSEKRLIQHGRVPLSTVKAARVSYSGRGVEWVDDDERVVLSIRQVSKAESANTVFAFNTLIHSERMASCGMADAPGKHARPGAQQGQKAGNEGQPSQATSPTPSLRRSSSHVSFGGVEYSPAHSDAEGTDVDEDAHPAPTPASLPRQYCEMRESACSTSPGPAQVAAYTRARDFLSSSGAAKSHDREFAHACVAVASATLAAGDRAGAAALYDEALPLVVRSDGPGSTECHDVLMMSAPLQPEVHGMLTMFQSALTITEERSGARSEPFRDDLAAVARALIERGEVDSAVNMWMKSAVLAAEAYGHGSARHRAALEQLVGRLERVERVAETVVPLTSLWLMAAQQHGQDSECASAALERLATAEMAGQTTRAAGLEHLQHVARVAAARGDTETVARVAAAGVQYAEQRPVSPRSLDAIEKQSIVSESSFVVSEPDDGNAETLSIDDNLSAGTVDTLDDASVIEPAVSSPTAAGTGDGDGDTAAARVPDGDDDDDDDDDTAAAANVHVDGDAKASEVAEADDAQVSRLTVDAGA